MELTVAEVLGGVWAAELTVGGGSLPRESCTCHGAQERGRAAFL